MEPLRTFSDCQKDDLIVITGAGGFIAGALVRYFREHGFTRIRAVDKKPLRRSATPFKHRSRETSERNGASHR